MMLSPTVSMLLIPNIEENMFSEFITSRRVDFTGLPLLDMTNTKGYSMAVSDLEKLNKSLWH